MLYVAGAKSKSDFKLIASTLTIMLLLSNTEISKLVIVSIRVSVFVNVSHDKEIVQ